MSSCPETPQPGARTLPTGTGTGTGGTREPLVALEWSRKGRYKGRSLSGVRSRFGVSVAPGVLLGSFVPCHTNTTTTSNTTTFTTTTTFTSTTTTSTITTSNFIITSTTTTTSTTTSNTTSTTAFTTSTTTVPLHIRHFLATSVGMATDD
ncbi:unnamed protein product [Boreogadus saida]